MEHLLQTPTPLVNKASKKILQLPSPEHVIYADTELELAQKHCFEMFRTGREGEATMSKEMQAGEEHCHQYDFNLSIKSVRRGVSVPVQAHSC